MEKTKLQQETSEKYSKESLRLANCMENEICPECNKDTNSLNNPTPEGFCREACYQAYIAKDPLYETLIQQAKGMDSYRNKSQTEEEENQEYKKAA